MEIDLMDWIIISVGLVTLGFYLGWVIRGFVIMANLAQDPDRIIDILNKIKRINESGVDDDGDSGVEAIRVERQGSMVYLFTEAKDEFIAQGASLQEALDQAGKRFPKRTFAGHISQDEAAALGVNSNK